MLFVRDVHAGVISDAPSVAELLLRGLKFLLSVGAFIAIMMIVISGIIYLSAADSSQRAALAKTALMGSVIGLVIVLVSLVVVNLALGVFGTSAL